jgi:hypothetical protein
MDLKTLASRNRIEDHQVETKRKKSSEMPVDIGTKALPVEPFVRLRDIASGYSLVKAAHPNFPMSKLVYDGKANEGVVSLQEIQRLTLQLTIVDAAEPAAGSSGGEEQQPRAVCGDDVPAEALKFCCSVCQDECRLVVVCK